MNMFRGFSYRLLRTFALTTGGSSALLLYMAFQALRGNQVFFIAGVVMLLVTVLFAYASWYNYQRRPLSLQGSSIVYSRVCPVCKEMLEEDMSVCSHCGQPLDS